MKQVLILLFVLALFIVATALQAQAAGAVAGTLTDENGEPVPGGTVLVVGTRRGAATDADGAFRIHGLLPGSYRLRITCVGSVDTVIRTVRVEAGKTAEIHGQLQSGGEIPEELICRVGHPHVDPTTTGKITEISGEELLR